MALKYLAQYVEIFSLARPRYALYQSMLARLEGSMAQAKRLAFKALKRVRGIEMTYEEGLAHDSIGRLPNLSAAERREHLRRAADLFEQLGANWDLARTQRALAALDG
jgi:hypothetical protein